MDEGKDEDNKNGANANSWWGSFPSWIQSAKEKSSTALEFMKRDLTEFSHVVQTDAVAAVSSTASLLKETLTLDNAASAAYKAQQSFTSVFETITDVFIPPQKELEDGELMVIKNSEPVTMDWWHSQLYLIRKDPKTFCHEPEGPPEMYENWLESFDPEEHEEEIADIVMTNLETRELYAKLVPTSVSHLEFWQRYFYRVHLLKKAEAKRADLMRKAEQISIEDVQWDKDCELAAGKLNLSQENPKAEKASGSQDTSHIVESHKICNTELILGTSQIDNSTSSFEDSTNAASNLNSIDTVTDKEERVQETANQSLNKETTDAQSELSSADSTDGSLSSPIECVEKDSSTGDDWEKDFDLEMNDNDLNNETTTQKPDSKKDDEDDWEKWQ